MYHTAAMNYESVSLWVAVASLLTSAAAVWIAKSSLSQARQVAERDRKDWQQRKWFDLYFQASETYHSLEHFQTLYETGSLSTAESVMDRNALMFRFRKMYAIAVVFPRNSVIDALASCADGLENPEEVLSKARLQKMFDAVGGLRLKALVNASVLD